MAPMVSKPFMLISTGREPIAQPHGIETRAYPNLDNSGPRTKIEALIVFTIS